MSLFAPKAACPHCHRKVRRPRDPGDFLCPHCHQPGPWATAEQAKAWDERSAARLAYQQSLDKLGSAGPDDSFIASLRAQALATGYTADELAHVNLEAIRRLALLAIQDDAVTLEEDRQLGVLVGALSLSWEQIRQAFPDLLNHLVIAEANAGLLPTVASPRLLAKRGEVVHLEVAAELLKEVTLHEFRGGYQGFSFPVGKTGIRYRIGGAKGHSVVTGTQIQVADQGTLSVSSARAVFIGARKTIEMPYSKLANLTVFSDGVQFHQSNRVSAPVFRVKDGEVAAAVVHAAAQRALNTSEPR